MKILGGGVISLTGLFCLWLAVTMAVSPALIVPVPEHGEAPERIAYDPTLTTEIARYIAAGLLAFFGLTLTVAPWRKRKADADESPEGQATTE